MSKNSKGEHFKTCVRCGKPYFGSKYSKVCPLCYRPPGRGFSKEEAKERKKPTIPFVYPAFNEQGGFEGFINAFNKEEARRKLNKFGFKPGDKIDKCWLNKE